MVILRGIAQRLNASGKGFRPVAEGLHHRIMTDGKLGRVALKPDAATIEQHEPITHDFRFRHIVRDQNRGESKLAPRRGDHHEDGVAAQGIQPGSRFVEKDEIGLGDQRTSKREALLLSAGELGRKETGAAGEIEPGHRIVRSPLDLLVWEVGRLLQRERDIGERRQRIEKRVALKEIAAAAMQRGARLRTGIGQRLTVETKTACVGSQDASQAFEEDGFPRTAFADDRHGFATRHREIHSVQHRIAVVGQAQSVGFEQWRIRFHTTNEVIT